MEMRESISMRRYWRKFEEKNIEKC